MSHTYPQRRGNKETIQIFHLATKKRRRGNRKAKGDGETEEENKKEKKKEKRKEGKRRESWPRLGCTGEKHAVNRVGSSELFTLSSDLPSLCPLPGKKEEPTINRARSSRNRRTRERKEEGRRKERR